MAIRAKEAIVKLLSGIFGIAVVVALLYWGINSQKSHDEEFSWVGSFYKGAGEERILADSDEFKTLDECYAWTIDRADFYELDEGGWEFSCGNDCSYTDETIVSGKRVKSYECAEVITE